MRYIILISGIGLVVVWNSPVSCDQLRCPCLSGQVLHSKTRGCCGPRGWWPDRRRWTETRRCWSWRRRPPDARTEVWRPCAADRVPAGGEADETPLMHGWEKTQFHLKRSFWNSSWKALSLLCTFLHEECKKRADKWTAFQNLGLVHYIPHTRESYLKIEVDVAWNFPVVQRWASLPESPGRRVWSPVREPRFHHSTQNKMFRQVFF